MYSLSNISSNIIPSHKYPWKPAPEKNIEKEKTTGTTTPNNAEAQDGLAGAR
jgi:hypothetical protein